MEIIVCIKQVPDVQEVAIDPETGVLQRAGVEAKMNPYDLYALEAALRLKERVGGRVRTITMGPPQAEAVIRESFMMGADAGVLLTDPKFAGADTLATAFTLSQGIQKMGPFDLILCGMQTTDGDTGQVGPGIAEFLHIPHVAYVGMIDPLGEGRIGLESDMGDWIGRLETRCPCLLTVTKGVGEPRLPSFRR
ncbi:MAG: electron transfer flavoprotein subunit beta/FixA family protein, partial [Limnochordia bacterium]